MQERVKSAEIATPGGLRVVDSSDSTGSLPVALKRDSPQLKITRREGIRPLRFYICNEVA
jgi:hypothetical protein